MDKCSNGRLLNLYNWLLKPIPFNRFGSIKKRWLRWCGICIDDSVELQPNVTIKGTGIIIIGAETVLREGVFIECNGGQVRIGARCEINYGTIIAANCGACVVIEDDTHIAHGCSIKCSTHAVKVGGGAGESLFKDIHIGMSSWLCAGVVILPGVKIGERNVLAAGTVVTKDTPSGVLMAGVPAVIKKQYGSERLEF